MNTRWRYALLVLTFIVWLALASVLVDSLWDDALFPLAVLQVLVLGFVYMVGRANPPQESASLPVRKTRTDEKRKHIPIDPETRMRLLLEMMDEDERHAFKQAMKDRMLSGSRDGELNYDADSLGALLDEDERYKRKGR